MKQVTIHEAKTHLSRLIQQALEGEEIVIAKRQQPLVRLEVLSQAHTKRRLGAAKGLVTNITDDFDDPLEDMQDYME